MNKDALIATIKEYPTAVVAGVVALVFLVLIFLRSGKTEAVKASLAAEGGILSRMEVNRLNTVNLQEDVEKITELNEAIEKRLMDITTEEKEVAYLQYLLALFERSGVQIANPAFGVRLEPKSIGVYTQEAAQYRTTYQLSEDMDTALQFVENLTTGPYFRVVESLTLKPFGAPETRGVSINLAVRTLAK
jgi:hypothetical protein